MQSSLDITPPAVPLLPAIIQARREAMLPLYLEGNVVIIPPAKRESTPLLPAPKVAGLLPEWSVTTTPSERVLSVQARRAPVLAWRVDNMVDVIKIAVRRGQTRRLGDGYALWRSPDGALVLRHINRPDFLTVGLVVNGRGEYVARRGEIRDFMVKVTHAMKRDVIHLLPQEAGPRPPQTPEEAIRGLAERLRVA